MKHDLPRLLRHRREIFFYPMIIFFVFVFHLHLARAEDSVPPPSAQTQPFKIDFEESKSLPSGWKTKGDVSIDTANASGGAHSLLFSRTEATVNQPCSADSPAFPTRPGQWTISLAGKTDLESPDLSYDGAVTLQNLDVSGKVIGQVVVATFEGRKDWQAATRVVTLPKGTVSSCFHIEIEKAPGKFWVDDLSAAFVTAEASSTGQVNRLYFTGVQLGNLLYPQDPRVFTATVESEQPLPADSRILTYVVRDYWGAEQTTPATTALTQMPEKNNGRTVYQATVNLSKETLEIGKYYELHGLVPQASGQPYKNFTAFAILPEASANSYRPLQIPFSIRNWSDNVPAYIQMSHRLGIRVVSVPVTWSPNPPYKVTVGQLDLCKQLNLGVIVGAPSGKIEHPKPGSDWEKYTDEVIRANIDNFIAAYGHSADPIIISMGNEPHGDHDQVMRNLAAYRSVYEEVKKKDPNMMVVGSSIAIERTEEYIKNGVAQICDAYDFHIYEDSRNVGNALKKYKVFFQKYPNSEKPVWSTELGLNTTPQIERRIVALEMVRKFTLFFAEGGANVSWFDLLMPDPDGTRPEAANRHETFDVFDSRYNRFAPKMPALTFYNFINALLVKKAAGQKQYGDVRAFLFRDNDHHNLLVVWKDMKRDEMGREDIFLPLPNVNDVEVIRIDGSHRRLNAGGKGLTLTASQDPLLLLYDGGAELPGVPGNPAASLVALPNALKGNGGSTELSVKLNDIKADQVDLLAPPFWEVKKAEQGNGSTIVFTLTSPKASSAREADLTVTLKDSAGARMGELYLRPPVSKP